MGNLYGLDIKYFVEVNFDGFKNVVDAHGRGHHQRPGPGLGRPLSRRSTGSLERVYIPSGIQHMNGAEALRYARSRHGSNDFDRGAAPAARPALAPRAGRPAGPDPAPAGAGHGAQEDGPDGHPGRPARPAARASPRRSTPRTSARTSSRRRSTRQEFLSSPRGYIIVPERRQDPGRGQRRVHGRPGRRGAAPEAGRGGRRRLGPQRHRRQRPRDAPRRLPRLPRPGRLGAAPEAGRARSRPTRRSSSTTAREAELPGHDRLPREDVRGDRDDQDGPGHPDGHHRHDRARRRRTSGAGRP